MAEKRHIQHLRSKVVSNNGQPKLPDSLLPGELAINYHKGTETISLQNDADEIVLFHDEVEISSGQPKVNTEIWIDLSDSAVTEVYTKQQIDSMIDSVVVKDYEQDDRLDVLERKTDELSGDTISKISQAIDELSGAVDTKVSELEEKDTELEEELAERALQSDLEAISGIVGTKVDESSFNDFSSSTESKIESISGLAENAYEVQIGTSADTISSNTKVFIDVNEDSSVLVYTKEQVDEQISGVTTLIDDNIVISDTTPTSVNTELFVDTSNDGPEYEVYTKEQTDTIVKEQVEVEVVKTIQETFIVDESGNIILNAGTFA